jgi:hypothetical protein
MVPTSSIDGSGDSDSENEYPMRSLVSDDEGVPSSTEAELGSPMGD